MSLPMKARCNDAPLILLTLRAYCSRWGITETYRSIPDDPPPSHPTNSNSFSPPDTVENFEDEQVGGGRRTPSPPPYQTTTRLWSTVKATNRDSGLVREAQARRGRLLEQASVPSSEHNDNPFLSEPVSCHASDAPQTVVQCTSQLFGGSQNSSNNSPFPPREAQAHGAPNANSRPPVSRRHETSAQTSMQSSIGDSKYLSS
ncbi:hypothetical protein HYDPIDRAFT_34992 [Hydnomerulius pinastri MD-312]|uniref:Uncharacterized protein n=1 Tax=Hydnomerulius pinastri MD-312 TaxID=994086 RepID=A0A0C2PWR2_9AGAM|nr:hypothetical protein HYDPIDRAFT_34992 [Hydnomerulius pinastri MD-312]